MAETSQRKSSGKVIFLIKIIVSGNCFVIVSARMVDFPATNRSKITPQNFQPGNSLSLVAGQETVMSY